MLGMLGILAGIIAYFRFWWSCLGWQPESFNISSVNSGSLSLRAYAVDAACNVGFGSGPNSLEIVEPWFTTKGGFVYSGGNINNPVRDLAGSYQLPSAVKSLDITI
jgi:hypothetical protein